MKLEDLDKVVRLREERENYLLLRNKIAINGLCSITMNYSDEAIGFNDMLKNKDRETISLEILSSLDKSIIEIEGKLLVLGVIVNARTNPKD